MFRNISGCHTDGVEGIVGVEALNIVEGIRLNMVLRVKSAAAQKHIADAGVKHSAIHDSDALILHRFQIAARFVVKKLFQIGGSMKGNRIVCGGNKHGCKIRLILQTSEFLRQGFLYC